MGKKVKIGKQRRDKAYWSAKELGFRSRASFKLVQLNRKHEFLQKSRVCIDLCAAPGSWTQVAKEYMPVTSLIVAVDLVPIKPIPGCVMIQGDITSEKCRSDLKKTLQTWKADLVLNDGAPNVGKNWLHDAYQQSLLCLHSFKLATEFLTKGGTFVTKVFRSKDYQSLMWVFNQFFKNVHATKPAASRNESAEIFVVCLNYKAPDKIDPKFLDPKHVFSEVEDLASAKDTELVNPEKKKKAPAEGYETGKILLYNKVNASEFIMGNNPIHVLNNCHEIILDEARIKKHPKTTQEIVECCKEFRSLGKKELNQLKRWRETLRADFERKEKEKLEKQEKLKANGETVEDKEDESDSDQDSDAEELEQEIESLQNEERLAERRKKKNALKEKRKIAKRIDLKMIIPGDEGPTKHEEGLFQISDLKSAKDVDAANDQSPDQMASDFDSDEETEKKAKMVKYSKEVSHLDKAGLFYKDETDSEAEESSEEDASDNDDLDIEADEKDYGIQDEDMDRLNDAPQNPLLVTMEPKDRNSIKQKKANLWFGKDIFKGIEDDEALEDADVQNAIDNIEKKGGQVLKRKEKPTILQQYHSDGSDEEEEKVDKEIDSSDSSSEEEEEKSKKVSKKRKKKKQIILTPEELALGQEMIKSKKARRDMMDSGWNRFMFDDKDANLPEWFVKEEEIHMRRHPDVDPQVVDFYKTRNKDVNVKTIKKVVEAKARKKRKLTKRMEKAKKKASNIMENDDIGSREKAKEIGKLYKKAASSIKKQETAYVVAKKHTASKRAKRPAGVKGPYKQVDPRMKKDTQGKRNNATNKRLQKRRLKGKKTRPNAK